MKAVVDIEFILAFADFMSTLLFVSFFIISNVPVFHNEAVREDLRSRVYQVSQHLIFNTGYPDNWDNIIWNDNDIETIGLSSGKNYILSKDKINRMDTLCDSDYTRVKNMLGQGYNTDIKIYIKDSDGNDLLSCEIGKKRTPEFQITRFATLEDGRLVKIDIHVF